MNLYLLEQNQNNDYDTYDSCVVASEDMATAQLINPSYEGWGEFNSSWCTHPRDVGVTYIGKASDDMEEGEIVIASFNAG